MPTPAFRVHFSTYSIMATLYKIRNWDDLFENNRSRAISHLQWVLIPNKHDGETFSAIMSHKDGAIIYTGWILMVQIASKCTPRGTLIKGNGVPHTCASMAAKCRFPAPLLQVAADYLVSKTDWLEAKEVTHEVPESGTQVPELGTQVPESGTHLTKKEGTEQKEGKEGDGPLVEFPSGFPVTVDDAIAQCRLIGASPILISELWNEAAALNGRAPYGGQAITRWANYVSAQKLRRENKQYERAAQKTKKRGFVP